MESSLSTYICIEDRVELHVGDVDDQIGAFSGCCIPLGDGVDEIRHFVLPLTSHSG